MALVGALGCGGGVATSGPNKVEIPVPDGTHQARTDPSGPSRQNAPPSGVTRESPFPRVARMTLANGLNVAVVTSRALPVVQARLLIRAGSGDGPTPAIAALTGDLLKAGGTRALPRAELLRRIETLGADLKVSTDFDATVLAMPLTKEQLGEGLALLSQVVREPRFDDGELRRLKARAIDEADEQARTSGRWTLTHLLFRELFPEKSAYRVFGMLPSHIAKVDGGAIRDFHRRFYVPKGATLVLAGDLDEGEAKTLVERHFGAWSGGERPKVERAAPRPLGPQLRVLIAHRPKSLQSEIYVATLGPARSAGSWPAVRVANEVLGGGVASRLFADVRERRALAYTTNVHTFELASGDQPVLAYAATDTGKTSQTVAALLENLGRMTTSPPTAAETEIARGYVSDAFAIHMETIGSVADMVVMQDEFGLPDGYWDAYRKQLRATDAPQVEAAAKKLYTQEKALVVVAGDADLIAPELAKLGDVTVVDPEKEFKTMRTIPQATR